MLTRFSFVVIAGVLSFGKICSADVFTSNFDMDGNYTQNLFSTTNASVWNETPSFPDVFYWAPTVNGVAADVIYRFQTPEPISSATVYAAIENFTGTDPSSQVLLDVSTDDMNWTNVANGTTGGGSGLIPAPINISSIVDGSTNVYIRARMFESINSGNIHYAQFLRTANGAGNQAPNVFQFSATTVPEPASLGIFGLGYVAVLRRKRRQI